MGRELDVARSALLASTVFAGGVALPLHAYATPSSIYQLLGAADGTVISTSGDFLGVLNSGGLGASASVSGASGPVAVYVGNGSTGAATLQIISGTGGYATGVLGGSVVIGTSAAGTLASAVLSNRAVLDISGGNIEFAHSTFLAITPGTNAAVISGGSFTTGTTAGGSSLISRGQTTMNPFDSSGGVVLSANVTSGALLVDNIASVIDSLVSSGLTTGGLTSHIIDVTVNGSGVGTGANGSAVSGGIGTGRQGIILVDVTSELTQALTLSAENPNDYFFVYLTNGIGSGGQILTGAADGSTPLASHIITIIGDTTTSGTQIYGQQNGTFIYTGNSGGAGGVLNVYGTINGGVFLANTTTTASELILNGGALIQANAWNGYIMASTNEPASLAGLAAGAVALGAVRRRKRRKPG